MGDNIKDLASITLSGHPGFLEPEQEKALEIFKVNLENAKLFTPSTDGSDASVDDDTLLRFLRARRFDPVKAQKQFADAQAWREENDAEALYANFDHEEFEHAKQFYPRWTGRRDKRGIPVYVYHLASLSGTKYKELQAVSPQRRHERIVALWEFMSRFTAPLCTHLPHSTPTPISSVTSIIDFSGCSIGTLWSLRSHLQQASTIANANYPETLNTIAVVNAPSFFNTVWGWIKNWFDEGTRHKVHVLGSDPGSTLRDLIDPEDLPKVYGGKLDFKFEDEPNLDDHAKEALGGDQVPKGPVLFINGRVVRPEIQT
ncbi:hypothetical protein JAAARDRAFT_30157 [Jaapia argillacea MUCL 33604]|uniref:CRAL-TRIO domain-containing protein n=1 Tax=Jaapia argillacea MUCL 33604 TaxID=933084 RepID=A0A067Q5D1_9AGAM|nr:hypothetical protein JAAARDRAFT_30157 [Jaapia argillacea MUCL 33604]